MGQDVTHRGGLEKNQFRGMGRVRSKSVKGVVVFFRVFLYEIRGVKKVHHIGVLQKINYGEGVLTPNITTTPRPTFLNGTALIKVRSV